MCENIFSRAKHVRSQVAEASSRCAQLRADLAALAARQETRHAETNDLREQAPRLCAACGVCRAEVFER